MNFRANFKGASLKPSVLSEDPEKDDKPATLTITLVVKSPDEELLGLLGRLAAGGERVSVSLGGYQMAFAASASGESFSTDRGG